MQYSFNYLGPKRMSKTMPQGSGDAELMMKPMNKKIQQEIENQEDVPSCLN